MKILTTVKRVPDAEQKLKIADGQLNTEGINWVLNPFDEYAVEAALRLVETDGGGSAKDGEVVALTVGPKDATQQLRSALAMGADRGIRVDGEEQGLDSEQVARILAAVYAREQPDLILMGKQTVDGENNQTAQLLAGYLNLPQACFACSIELGSDGKLTVAREVDGGTETKKVPLPAVVTVDLRIVLPKAVKNPKSTAEYAEGARYASLKGIMQAKKKKVEELTVADLGVASSGYVTLVSVEKPAERQAGVKVESVDELVNKLRNEARVI